jgi:KDO2-lipid IV(A) lauroyltransferase
VLSWVKSTSNWKVIDVAIKRGKGIIFLTPHMGCFEITSLYYGNSHPITILFRPPKRKWLSILSAAGRSNGKIKQAPANSSGVRLLLQALKNGEAIGILPDQIPAKGEGEWATFFGQPAYTMTLVSKLANKTGATVIMAFGERLTDGRGFTVHLNELIDGSIATSTMLNRAIEEQIKEKPHQYLWAYPRYKTRGRHINKPIE